jgi:hypothetical protein
MAHWSAACQMLSTASAGIIRRFIGVLVLGMAVFLKIYGMDIEEMVFAYSFKYCGPSAQ